MLRAVPRLRAAAGVVVTALTLVVLAALLGGCSGGAPQATPSTPPPTPIARLNTAQLELHRIPFCDLLPRQAVTDALGTRATDHATWGAGDAATFVGGSGDRAQEFGCRYSAGDTGAAAWVFASPVEAAFARTVVRDSAEQHGCRDTTGAAFGSPDELQTCQFADGVVRVRHAGLFGQTWLTCQVAAPLPRDRVADRADDWCVQVANVLNTSH